MELGILILPIIKIDGAELVLRVIATIEVAILDNRKFISYAVPIFACITGEIEVLIIFIQVGILYFAYTNYISIYVM